MYVNYDNFLLKKMFEVNYCLGNKHYYKITKLHHLKHYHLC